MIINHLLAILTLTFYYLLNKLNHLSTYILIFNFSKCFPLSALGMGSTCNVSTTYGRLKLSHP
jgi:hypothetical protein